VLYIAVVWLWLWLRWSFDH